MPIEKVVLQSAGSLSVALIALMMVVLQLVFILRRTKYLLYGWSLGISFSAMLYAIGIFFEYNASPGVINQWAGRLEFTAIIFLIHILYGFTFSYLNIDGTRFHRIFLPFHLLLLFAVWCTDIVVSEEFVVREFIGLSQPFLEPALGPAGPFFVFYALLAALGAIMLWFRLNDPGDRFKGHFLFGTILWTLLGIHDGMAALGMAAYQYIMEYGFLIFAFIVLWMVFNRYYEMLSEDKYRTITRYVNDGILVLQEGRAVFENAACRSLIGRSVIGWAMEDFSTVLSETDRIKLSRFYDSSIHSREQGHSITINIGKKERGESIVEIKANAIQYKSGTAFLAVLRDITERIRKEKALKESEDRVARLKKMESLGLLAGGVAHDLNNVLSGIVSYPELILMELPEDSKLRQPILTIQDSGQRAAAIVNELLTIARGAAIEKKAMSLNRVIEAYVRSPEHKKTLMFHPNVTVETDLDPRLFPIRGSWMHFSKAIMNLVSNAAEAIEGQGTVVISTANRRLNQTVNGYCSVPEGEYAVLSVADNGPGIKRDDLDRIFEPFFTKKVMGRSGTGLGLTLVWNVVQDHDFHIDVISNKKGTRFDLYCLSTHESVAEEINQLPLTYFYGQGERILVVDDVKNQREVTCLMLNKLGYRADSVSCGERAVDYIKTHGGVDLLLLDMIMDPGINGRETYERIKKIQPDQKAILLSGFAETGEVRQAIKIGAAKYLKKPVTINVLGQAVKEAVS